MKFWCPTCEMWRHVDEDDDDPREDRCWACFTRVPWTEAELSSMDAEGSATPEGKA